MSTTQPTDLGRALVRFFQDYLPSQRGVSPHTIRSYRDTVVLLLQFAAGNAGRRIERMQIVDMKAEPIKRFLNFPETDRHNRIATRKAHMLAPLPRCATTSFFRVQSGMNSGRAETMYS
jgi:integrase/recombinase XerD